MQLTDLMAMAGQMRDKLAQVQAQTERLRVQGEAGGGMVKVVLNGLHQVVQLSIDPSVCQGAGDLPLVASLVRSAMNQAVGKLAEQAPASLGKMAAELGLDPGALGDLGGSKR